MTVKIMEYQTTPVSTSTTPHICTLTLKVEGAYQEVEWYIKQLNSIGKNGAGGEK